MKRTCSIRSRCSWHRLAAERWLLARSFTSCSSKVLITSLTLQSSLSDVELPALSCRCSRTLAMASFSSLTKASLQVTLQVNKLVNKLVFVSTEGTSLQSAAFNATHCVRSRCISASADLLTPWEAMALSSAFSARTSFWSTAGSGFPR